MWSAIRWCESWYVGKLEGMRLVIDPGFGEWDPGYRMPQSAARAAWALELARALARICEARGDAVVVTRIDEAFVPRMVRRAYAREFGPDIILTLGLGYPSGQSGASVRFGFRWWQSRRGRTLAGHLLAAIKTAFPLGLLPVCGVRFTACAGMVAPLRTIPLLVVVYLPANPSPGGVGDPDLWATALADGLLAYCLGGDGAAVDRNAVPQEPDAVDPGLQEPPAAAPPAAERAAEPPRAVLLVPGQRHPLIGAPLLGPRGFTATPPPRLPAGSTSATDR